MIHPPAKLIEKLESLITRGETGNHWSREELMDAANRIDGWKMENGIHGIWNHPPMMVTATLDDGIGQGLELIHTFANLMGLRLLPLGLLKTADEIIETCLKANPEFLGLTVLQFDSEADLSFIGHHLPQKTRLIAGGPVFRSDPELAGRAGVFYVAEDVLSFVRFMLTHLKAKNNNAQ